MNPLGEGREFNSGLLKPKGRLLSLPYHYGTGWLFFDHWVLMWTIDLAFLKAMENQYLVFFDPLGHSAENRAKQ